MEFEGRREFAYQFSQLTEGIGSDVPGLIGLRYCDPVVCSPQQILRVVQTCAWKPSRNLLDVTLFQRLRDDVCVCVEKTAKRERTLVGGTEEMMPKNCHRSSQNV